MERNLRKRDATQKSVSLDQSLAAIPQRLLAAIAVNDDFGHEMRVTDIFRTAAVGTEVEHAGMYSDPVETKPRQFDIRCMFTKALTFGPVRFYLAVECKNLDPASPFIVCRAERASRESFHDRIYSIYGGFPQVIAGRPSCSPYARGLPVGKSVMRFRPRGNDFERATGPDGDFSARWIQALSSAHELCQRAARAASQEHPQVNSVVLPFLVVPDGSMWALDYDNRGKPKGEPQLADSIEFYTNLSVPLIKEFTLNYRISHLHFLTLRGLAAFLSGFGSKDDATKEWFPTDLS